MKSEAKACIECGTPLPVNSNGFCLRCCLHLGIDVPNEPTEPADNYPEEKPKVGRALSGYELLEKVGEGGMGVVYRARQVDLGRTVAVKMLRSGALASEAEVKRFRREAKAAARLQHPNIVAIHEVREHDHVLFFSMDFIQGQNLSQIAGRTPLPPARAARYAMIIAEAIHHAHTNGILHRDLKPANVLIDEHDQPKITDFGIAKGIGGEADVTLSGTGELLGTPSYMSPEQASAQHQLIGPATDIYSIGALLYDLLTGRPPFRAHSPAETLRQVIESEPAAPRLLNSKIDRGLETICLKCLTKDPERRYATARELADDLGRYLNGEPINARPAGTTTRLFKWTRRHPGLALAGAVFALMFVAVAFFSHRDAVDGASSGAWIAASLMKQQLEELRNHVSVIATNRELRALVHTTSPPLPKHDQLSTSNPFIPLLNRLFEEHSLPLSDKARFENLLLIHSSGEVWANYNPAGTVHVPNVMRRDYFIGATNTSSGVFISKAFKAWTDGKYKVGLSTPIRDSQGRVLAVLAAMIGTSTNKVPAGLKRERTETVLIAILDPLDETTSAARAYAIIRHPAYEPGRTNVVATSHKHVKALLSKDTGFEEFLLDTFYEDPVFGPWWRQGWWVAGFSRVPDTRLVVVYQIRDRAAQVLFYGSIFAAVCAVSGFASVQWKRHLVRRGRIPVG